MLIWRCDVCGHDETRSQICGNEFKYIEAGIKSLNYGYRREAGGTDLCRKCYAEFEAKSIAADKVARAAADKARAESLGCEMPPTTSSVCKWLFG